MGRTPENTASVRVELSEDDRLIAPPPPDGGRDGYGSPRALAVIAAGAILVVALIVLTRPEAGQTAVGSPITARSTDTDVEIDTSESDSAPEVNSVLPPTTTENTSGTALVPEFDSAEIDFYPFEVVKVGLRWIALGFGDDDQGGGLWQSVDGLSWIQLDNRGFPQGDILGFSYFDDHYVIAVDETATWSTQPAGGDLGNASFRISIWQSADTLLWLPSERLPPHEGVGFPYPVSISPSAYVVPSLGPAPGGEYAVLVDYLSEVLEPDLGRRVCRAEREAVEEDRQLVLLDCLDEELVRVSRTDDEALFDSLDPDCVEVARGVENNQPSVTYIDALTGQHRIPLDDQFGLFGVLIESEFITPTSPFSQILPPHCSGVAPGSPDHFAANVLVWNPAGARTIAGPEEIQGSSVGASFRSVLGTRGGSAMMVGQTGLWMAEPPFTSWDLVLSSSPDDGGPGLDARLSLTSNGSLVMGTSADMLFFGKPGGEWSEVDFGRLNEFPVLLVATEEYAIVLLQRAEPRVVKIPLSP